MLATNRARAAGGRQGGAFAVEFALVLTAFLGLIYGSIEMARVIYVLNTSAEITRRAAQQAAVTDYRDRTAIARVQQAAVFRSSPGLLPFGAPVSDQHVTIDYLALTRNGSGALALTPIPSGSLPSCPARNRQVCSLDPNDASCIRFVRARICAPGSGANCAPVIYEPVVPLLKLPMKVPPSTTIVPAQSLGFTLGTGPCI